jgi:hypothetical protein
MLTQHIALVPEAENVDPSELARVTAALQKQVMRDLSPIWNVTATVNAFPYLEDVPVGYWPIVLTSCELGTQAGLHIDRNGQPYAQVAVSPSWSVDASRVCLEMLVNPFGNRSVTGVSLRSDQGTVEFLLEICGPCANPFHAYVINDVLVSDFCIPAFFETGSATSGARYSFNGSARTPFQVLPGGHITWYDPISNNCWVRSHWGDNPIDTELGAIDGSMRGLGRWRAPLRLQAGTPSPAAAQSDLEERRQQALRASQFRAYRLRSLLAGDFDSERDVAFEILQTRRDVHDSSQPRAALLRAPGAAPQREAPTWVDWRSAKTVVERQAQRFDEDDEDMEISLHLLDDDESVSADDAPTAVDSMYTQTAVDARHATLRPPLPTARHAPGGEAGAPASVPRAATQAQVAPAQPSGASPAPAPTPTFPPVELTVPPGAQPSQRSRARDGLLLVAGVLAGAMLLALAWNGSRSVSRSSASGVGTNPPQQTSLVEPAPAAPPKIATAVPTATTPPIVLGSSTVVATVSPRAASPMGNPTPPRPARLHRALDRMPSPTPPSAERSNERPASEPKESESLDDLIDTRR